MLYPYLTLGDDTEILHTHIISENGSEKVQVHFERPQEDGFAAARCVLPKYEWVQREKFTDEEMAFFSKFLEHNAALIFKYARSGGIKFA